MNFFVSVSSNKGKFFSRVGVVLYLYGCVTSISSHGFEVKYCQGGLNYLVGVTHNTSTWPESSFRCFINDTPLKLNSMLSVLYKQLI